jgi:hypothetical protein
MWRPGIRRDGDPGVGQQAAVEAREEKVVQDMPRGLEYSQGMAVIAIWQVPFATQQRPERVFKNMSDEPGDAP